jgi:hypothetical protein
MLAVALVLVRAHSSIIHEPYYSIIRHLHCCSGTMFFLNNRAFVSAHQNATTKEDEDVNQIRHKTMSSFLLYRSLQPKEKWRKRPKKNIYLCMLPERWTQEDVFAASLRVVSHDLMKFVKNWSV